MSGERGEYNKSRRLEGEERRRREGKALYKSCESTRESTLHPKLEPDIRTKCSYASESEGSSRTYKREVSPDHQQPAEGRRRSHNFRPGAHPAGLPANNQLLTRGGVETTEAAKEDAPLAVEQQRKDRAAEQGRAGYDERYGDALGVCWVLGDGEESDCAARVVSARGAGGGKGREGTYCRS